MSRLAQALCSGQILLMDGAMGTQLQGAGIGAGECYEAWNITRPDVIQQIHRAYVAAGATVLVTNTFQANPVALGRHFRQSEPSSWPGLRQSEAPVATAPGLRSTSDPATADFLKSVISDVIMAGVMHARMALAGAGWVLADIGPFNIRDALNFPLSPGTRGERAGVRGDSPPHAGATILQGTSAPSPLPLSPEYRGEGNAPNPVVDDAIATMLKACADADGILLETFSNPADAEVILRVNASLPTSKPALLSFTFDGAAMRTFFGVSPEDCARAATAMKVVALGVNCGREMTMEKCAEILRRYRTVSSVPLFARVNAGTPRDGVYPLGPEKLAAGVPSLLEAGATMVGGCCGTTPGHIQAFREVGKQSL